MTPAEFIAVCRRRGACEEGIARFKRRRGTVDQRLAATAKASRRSTYFRETHAEEDLAWLRDYGPREYGNRLRESTGHDFGFTYDAPKPKRRTKARLKAARIACGYTVKPSDVEAGARATDLRVKRWGKP